VPVGHTKTTRLLSSHLFAFLYLNMVVINRHVYLHLNKENKINGGGAGSGKSFCQRLITALIQYPQILLVKLKTLYILKCLA